MLAEGFRECRKHIQVMADCLLYSTSLLCLCELAPGESLKFELCVSLGLYQDENLVRNFLDTTLTSRLGIRMLATHHLALHEDNVSCTLQLKT